MNHHSYVVEKVEGEDTVTVILELVDELKSILLLIITGLKVHKLPVSVVITLSPITGFGNELDN